MPGPRPLRGQYDPARPITSRDPAILKAAIDGLGDEADDDRDRAFYRRALARKLAALEAHEAHIKQVNEEAGMDPEKLARGVPRWA